MRLDRRYFMDLGMASSKIHNDTNIDSENFFYVGNAFKPTPESKGDTLMFQGSFCRYARVSQIGNMGAEEIQLVLNKGNIKQEPGNSYLLRRISFNVNGSTDVYFFNSYGNGFTITLDESQSVKWFNYKNVEQVSLAGENFIKACLKSVKMFSEDYMLGRI